MLLPSTALYILRARFFFSLEQLASKELDSRAQVTISPSRKVPGAVYIAPRSRDGGGRQQVGNWYRQRRCRRRRYIPAQAAPMCHWLLRNAKRILVRPFATEFSIKVCCILLVVFFSYGTAIGEARVKAKRPWCGRRFVFLSPCSRFLLWIYFFCLSTRGGIERGGERDFSSLRTARVRFFFWGNNEGDK